MESLKTINYRNHTINVSYSGWYSSQTSRYGIVKSDTLKGIKEYIDKSISLN
jgi:hypothetical protein